jgi:hypothetical protein
MEEIPKYKAQKTNKKQIAKVQFSKHLFIEGFGF